MTSHSFADDDQRVAWLKRNALQVRTIDPLDDDFSDLMPLKELIGNTRIVQLGEQSHGDGATFLAKARLIRFLHEKMGFDVLAWESGLFDGRLVHQALQQGMTPGAAARKGIPAIWAESGHVKPVIDYVRTTHRTDRPIEIAGFDCHLSLRGNEVARESIEAFFDRVSPDVLDATQRSQLGSLLAWLPKMKDDATEAEHRAWRQLIGRLLQLLDEQADRIAALHGHRETAFVRRLLLNLLAAEEERVLLHKEKERNRLITSFESSNVRDAAMADTLAWLAEEYYPERKIMVWAASLHLMYSAADVAELDGARTYESFVPMGHFVRRRLGNQVYTIAFTAHSGRKGWPMWGQYELTKPSSGSLEDLFHRTGKPYLLLDFKHGSRQDDAAWLRERLTARPLGYSDMRAAWPECFDAMFFTDVMFPSEAHGELPEGVRTVQRPEPSLERELQRFGELAVSYRLDQDGQDHLGPPDGTRLADRPPATWPKLHGYFAGSAARYRSLADPSHHDPKADRAGFFLGKPLRTSIVCDGRQTLVLAGGITTNGAVTTKQPASVFVAGDMNGRLVVKRPATVIIDGDVFGPIECDAPTHALITGRLNGSINFRRGRVLYVMDGLGPRFNIGPHLEVPGEPPTVIQAGLSGEVYLGGHVPKVWFEFITGDARYHVERSDLPPGEHVVENRQLTPTGEVVVKGTKVIVLRRR